jgi:hypothetical protein
MHKCYTPCIYYNEKYDRSKKPMYKIVCDMKDGEEIRNIPQEEIDNCTHYKSYTEVRSKRLLTEV